MHNNVPRVTLTPAAIAAVIALHAEDGDNSECLRVTANPPGVWPRYALDSEQSAKAGDIILKFPGLTVVVDSASAEVLRGVVIDWVPTEKSFRFTRPIGTL